MSVIGEVRESLGSMGFGPLLLAMVFLASYPLAIGSFATPVARRRCQVAAALCVIGFAAMAPSWVHAAVIAAVGIAAIGGFIVMAWLLSRALGVASRRMGSEGSVVGEPPAAPTATAPLTARPARAV